MILSTVQLRARFNGNDVKDILKLITVCRVLSPINENNQVIFATERVEYSCHVACCSVKSENGDYSSHASRIVQFQR